MNSDTSLTEAEIAAIQCEAEAYGSSMAGPSLRKLLAENARLRAEAKSHAEARQMLADDLIALARGKEVKLALGEAVEKRLASSRREALEEAARVAETWAQKFWIGETVIEQHAREMTGNGIAAAIRALIEKPQ